MAHDYVTRQGETWDTIARNAYGTELLASHVMKANPGYLHLLKFPAGIVLTLPEPPADANLGTEAPWKRGAMLSEVPNAVGTQIIPAGVYGSGTGIHGDLEGRNEPNQHELSAIAWNSRSMDTVMREVYSRLDDVESGIGDGGNGSGGTGGGRGGVFYFTADGESTSHRVEHNLGSVGLLVQTFDEVTGEHVYFADKVAEANAVVLTAYEPLPAGTRVRVVLQVAGSGGSGVGGGSRATFVHEQAAPATVWQITHSLGERYPSVLTLDDEGDVMIGAVDWEFATENYLSISFFSPTGGKAILST